MATVGRMVPVPVPRSWLPCILVLVLVSPSVGGAMGQDKILGCQQCSADDECASGSCDDVFGDGDTRCASSDPASPCELAVRSLSYAVAGLRSFVVWSRSALARHAVWHSSSVNLHKNTSTMI